MVRQKVSMEGGREELRERHYSCTCRLRDSCKTIGKTSKGKIKNLAQRFVSRRLHHKMHGNRAKQNRSSFASLSRRDMCQNKTGNRKTHIWEEKGEISESGREKLAAQERTECGKLCHESGIGKNDQCVDIMDERYSLCMTPLSQRNIKAASKPSLVLKSSYKKASHPCETSLSRETNDLTGRAVPSPSGTKPTSSSSGFASRSPVDISYTSPSVVDVVKGSTRSRSSRFFSPQEANMCSGSSSASRSNAVKDIDLSARWQNMKSWKQRSESVGCPSLLFLKELKRSKCRCKLCLDRFRERSSCLCHSPAVLAGLAPVSDESSRDTVSEEDNTRDDNEFDGNPQVHWVGDSQPCTSRCKTPGLTDQKPGPYFSDKKKNSALRQQKDVEINDLDMQFEGQSSPESEEEKHSELPSVKTTSQVKAVHTLSGHGLSRQRSGKRSMASSDCYLGKQKRLLPSAFSRPHIMEAGERRMTEGRVLSKVGAKQLAGMDGQSERTGAVPIFSDEDGFHGQQTSETAKASLQLLALSKMVNFGKDICRNIYEEFLKDSYCQESVMNEFDSLTSKIADAMDILQNVAHAEGSPTGSKLGNKSAENQPASTTIDSPLVSLSEEDDKNVKFSLFQPLQETDEDGTMRSDIDHSTEAEEHLSHGDDSEDQVYLERNIASNISNVLQNAEPWLHGELTSQDHTIGECSQTEERCTQGDNSVCSNSNSTVYLGADVSLNDVPNSDNTPLVAMEVDEPRASSVVCGKNKSKKYSKCRREESYVVLIRQKPAVHEKGESISGSRRKKCSKRLREELFAVRGRVKPCSVHREGKFSSHGREELFLKLAGEISAECKRQLCISKCRKEKPSGLVRKETEQGSKELPLGYGNRKYTEHRMEESSIMDESEASSSGARREASLEVGMVEPYLEPGNNKSAEHGSEESSLDCESEKSSLDTYTADEREKSSLKHGSEKSSLGARNEISLEIEDEEPPLEQGNKKSTKQRSDEPSLEYGSEKTASGARKEASLEIGGEESPLEHRNKKSAELGSEESSLELGSDKSSQDARKEASLVGGMEEPPLEHGNRKSTEQASHESSLGYGSEKSTLGARKETSLENGMKECLTEHGNRKCTQHEREECSVGYTGEMSSLGARKEISLETEGKVNPLEHGNRKSTEYGSEESSLEHGSEKSSSSASVRLCPQVDLPAKIGQKRGINGWEDSLRQRPKKTSRLGIPAADDGRDQKSSRLDGIQTLKLDTESQVEVISQERTTTKNEEDIPEERTDQISCRSDVIEPPQSGTHTGQGKSQKNRESDEKAVNCGDLVWGRLSLKSPAWPGVVINGEQFGLEPVTGNRCWVFWFGDHKISKITVSQMSSFVVNFLNLYQRKRGGKLYHNGVVEAIRICRERCSAKLCELDSGDQLVRWALSGFPVGVSPWEKPLTSRDLLTLVRRGEVRIEDVCIVCFDDRAIIFVQHPAFKGGVCTDCKNGLTETLFSVGENGIQVYCSVCGEGGELIIICKPACGRVYCEACVKNLAGQKILQEIHQQEDWSCFMCTPYSKATHGLLEGKANWEENVDRMCGHVMMNCGVKVHKETPLCVTRRPLRVLSLCDRIGTGALVLDRLGFEVEQYFVCELDHAAKAVVEHNYGDCVTQLGNMDDLHTDTLSALKRVDLILGYPPSRVYCREIPDIETLFVEDGDSMTEFARICHVLAFKRPTHVFWLCESEASMKDVAREHVSLFLQAEPVLMNAAWFSYPDRAKYFWGNIPGRNRPSSCEVFNTWRAAQTEPVTLPEVMTNRDSGDGEMIKQAAKGVDEVEALERELGFPIGYTNVPKLSHRKRIALLEKAASVPLLTHMLSPLREFFKLKE